MGGVRAAVSSFSALSEISSVLFNFEVFPGVKYSPQNQNKTHRQPLESVIQTQSRWEYHWFLWRGFHSRVQHSRAGWTEKQLSHPLWQKALRAFMKFLVGLHTVGLSRGHAVFSVGASSDSDSTAAAVAGINGARWLFGGNYAPSRKPSVVTVFGKQSCDWSLD